MIKSKNNDSIKLFYKNIDSKIEELKANKLFKAERIIKSPQNSNLTLSNSKKFINFCANNYLGLADDQDLIQSAKTALNLYGYGMASVRFICGTSIIHKELECALSEFLAYPDCILYSSCFDANGGIFEVLLSEEDAIISDELNHASIIDGIRLCKAQRFRYKNNNMNDLENQLQAAKDSRYRLIVTDGVFSMDGTIANLAAICDLADKYDALVMVDDSHATGFIGNHGRGTPEYCGVEHRIDIISGTLGKALGGASGGFVVAKQGVIDLLRNFSRPYLFSNSLAPMIAATSIKALEKIRNGGQLRADLNYNTKLFRTKMIAAGFDVANGVHPIVPIMLYDEKLAVAFAEKLLLQDIYVIAFSYPVVAQAKARIRVQISAKHTEAQILQAVAAFELVAQELGVIN